MSDHITLPVMSRPQIEETKVIGMTSTSGGPPSQGMNLSRFEDKLAALGLRFTGVVMDHEDLPFCQPNVPYGKEYEFLFQLINGVNDREPEKDANFCWTILDNLWCVPCTYSCPLVDQGHWGMVRTTGHIGKYEMLGPGRYCWASSVREFMGSNSLGADLVRVGNVTVARVPDGQFGLAMEGSRREVLLPGLHVRNSASFHFDRLEEMNKELVEYGNIKLLTVPSGSVYATLDDGHVRILEAGRYLINKGSFVIKPDSKILTQQTNFRLGNHPVLLDGGIGMLVEGLLTYQVRDAQKLVMQIGTKDLQRAISDVTKAELSRVFATLHLEQISKVDFGPIKAVKAAMPGDEEAPPTLLGKENAAPTEGETRNWICDQVVRCMSPLTDSWGVSVVNFQLESTKIQDPAYATRYEAASLEVAKAKADLRTQNMNSQIQIQRAQADAAAARVKAEGEKVASITQAEAVAERNRIEARALADRARIEAEANAARVKVEAEASAGRTQVNAEAEAKAVEIRATAEAGRVRVEADAQAYAREKEGTSRNAAAEAMRSEFAKQFAVASLQVDFAKNLRPNHLQMNLMPDSAIAQGLMGASLFANAGLALGAGADEPAAKRK